MDIRFDPNEWLLKFQEKHVADIVDFTHPLRQILGATFFAHVRVDRLGGFRSLMTDTQLANYYHQMQYPIAYSNGKGISLDNGFYVVGVENGLSVIKDRKILASDFNVEHLIYIVSKNTQFDDLYVFGSNEHNFINLFVNNMDVVKHFIHYFNYSSRKLIKNCPNILYPKELFQGNFSNAISKKQSDYLNKMPLQKIFLTVNGRSISVSAKEYSCLKFLIGSLTIKEIAKKMDLSPRTVETYFNSIKKKLQCESRSQLYEFMKSIYLV